MPAQPPFLTPTRTPTIGCSAFAITYLMRSAAASVRRIAWGLARGVAIRLSPRAGGKGRGGTQSPKITTNLPLGRPRRRGLALIGLIPGALTAPPPMRYLITRVGTRVEALPCQLWKRFGFKSDLEVKRASRE